MRYNSLFEKRHDVWQVRRQVHLDMSSYDAKVVKIGHPFSG